MTIQNNTVIYVLCPGNIHSGGPELMHQFASRLIANGYDARMYYTEPKEKNPVDPFYAAWHIPFARDLEDEPQNIVVFPETALSAFNMIQKAQRVIWWLSVDHYLMSYLSTLENHIPFAAERPIPAWYLFQKDISVQHFVQSEYARRFVAANSVPEDCVHMLGDYLNPVFLQKAGAIDSSVKRDYIAYNPQKGMAFTQKLIAAAPELKWVPIQNMTPAQVETLLAGAKVYVDFGYHPGKDRIPREAAVSGCCVITSRKGAAANGTDVAIPETYKFPDTEENIPRVLSLIRDILADYPLHTKAFDPYRESIRREPAQFMNDVNTLFPPRGESPVTVAYLADAAEVSAIPPVFSPDTDRVLSFVVDEECRDASVSVKSRSVPVISYADALFLYREDRIGCFAFASSSEEERTLMTQTLLSIGVDAQHIMEV